MATYNLTAKWPAVPLGTTVHITSNYDDADTELVGMRKVLWEATLWGRVKTWIAARRSKKATAE